MDRGDDAFVRAVENAPAAFPLMTPEQRQRAQELRLEQSPLAPDIASQEATHALFRSVVMATKKELAKLAESHRAQLDVTE